jgi:predicted enzyme related to lactoylglutathione lyase
MHGYCIAVRMKFRVLVLAMMMGGHLAAQNPPMVTDPTPAAAAAVAKPEMLDLIPSFAVGNAERAIAFYEKLGFVVVLKSGDYTAMGRDAVQIGLFHTRSTAQTKPGSVYIQISQVDDFYREVKNRGLKITRDLRTQPSKMREFSVTDPDNNTIVFGEYAGSR